MTAYEKHFLKRASSKFLVYKMQSVATLRISYVSLLSYAPPNQKDCVKKVAVDSNILRSMSFKVLRKVLSLNVATQIKKYGNNLISEPQLQIRFKGAL